jgi:hypothetical protein
MKLWSGSTERRKWRTNRESNLLRVKTLAVVLKVQALHKYDTGHAWDQYSTSGLLRAESLRMYSEALRPKMLALRPE